MTYEEFTSKFKKGDIIKGGFWIFMYNGLRLSPNQNGDFINHAIIFDCLASLDYGYTTFVSRTGIGCIEDRNFELASNKEIQQMIKTINKEGYDWDFDEQKLIPFNSNIKI